MMKKMGLKKRMAILLILLAGGHMTARPGVIITGILDGTLDGGCPKVIELFVTGTENLNYYEVWRSLNGAPFGSGSGAISSMSGVYTNTFVYLVKTDHVDAFHDVFGNEGIYANVVPMGIINGNGNDGFQVRQKVGSVVIDQVWYENASNSYEDSYWYRKHGTGPDGGWFPSAWETPGNNALDGLYQDGLQAAVPFGTYAMAWQGLTTDWNSTNNWSLGIVPSFQTNVLITDTAGNFPVITNPPESPAVCMNLTIADTARLTVQAGKALTVFGNLILETQVPGGPERGLILESDTSQTQTGSLILFGYVTGTAIFKRYLAKDNGWHFLSSPVSAQQFQPEFVPEMIDNSFDLYFWDENAGMAEGWINARDANGLWNPLFSDTLITGQGYLVAYAPSNNGNLVRTFEGLPISGNFNIPLGHSGNFWNLLGNPYPSSLNWASAGIDKELIAGSAMYIWDPALNDNQGGYRTHNGTTGVPEGTTSIIPALQGFFVQSLDTGNLSVVITLDNPLVHANQVFYKDAMEVENQRIRLKIGKDQVSDETLICFDTKASNDYDPQYDAEKLFNGHNNCPEIYSLSGSDHPLFINMLSSVPASVPLGIKYTGEDILVLTAFDFEQLDPETGIILEDYALDSWIDLREQPEYWFSHDPLLGEGRFTLHLMNYTGEKEKYQPGLSDLWYAGNRVYVSNPENTSGKLDLYALDGKAVENFDLPGGNGIIITDAPTGLYVLRLATPFMQKSLKIFIN